MQESILLWGALGFTVLGMGFLALSLKPHWQAFFPDRKVQPKPFLMRSIGALCLFVSMVGCFNADHPSMAVLVWIMLLPLAAGLVAMIFTLIGADQWNTKYRTRTRIQS